MKCNVPNKNNLHRCMLIFKLSKIHSFAKNFTPDRSVTFGFTNTGIWLCMWFVNLFFCLTT